MNNKILKIVFWISTGLFSLMMLFSAYAYLTNDEMREGFIHLGFSNYFRIELAIAKILGAAVLLFPFPARLKEWAYAGFTITLISAFIAHVSVGDPLSKAIAPLIAGIVLAASYITFRRRSEQVLA